MLLLCNKVVTCLGLAIVNTTIDDVSTVHIYIGMYDRLYSRNIMIPCWYWQRTEVNHSILGFKNIILILHYSQRNTSLMCVSW